MHVGIGGYHMRRLLVLAAACATLVPAGCANLNSISRTRFTSGEAAVHYADAQQWGVLSQRWAEYPHEGGAGYWVYRSCAQPSPDVFSVLGFSLAGAISRDKQDDGKSLNAEVATALSQSGATISRTQTVNLLRESMYRTCERFMNGAMSEEQFLVQAARDQRAMIAILAIEQLTGVVLPSSTVIVANGTAIQTDRPLEVLQRLEEAEADEAEKAAALTSAKTKAAAAETRYKTLNKDDACKKLLEAKAETPAEEADDAPASPTKEECKTALDESTAAADDVTQKTKAHKAAETHLGAVRAVIEAGPGGGVARTQASGQPGGGRDQASAADREKIADVVESIVHKAFSDSSEMSFVCIGALNKKDTPAPLFQACVQRLVAQAEAETKAFRLN